MRAGEEGRRRLADRLVALPERLREELAAPPLDLGLRVARGARVVATGLGSSAAHARFLAQILNDGGVAARAAPLGALREIAVPGAADGLVVFSQGLSPNARLAFEALDRFAWAIVVTAAAPGRAPDDAAPIPWEKSAFLAELAARGVAVVPFGGAEEYGSLLRVTGPMLGYAAALRIAAALGADGAFRGPGEATAPARTVEGLAQPLAPASTVERLAETLASASTVEGLAEPQPLPPSGTVEGLAETVARAVAAAPARLERECPGLDTGSFDLPISFLATGGYAECVWNLRLKVLEGLLRPLPPVWDPIEIAHGPFQQALTEPATFLAWTRPDAWREADLLDRFERMLPRSHRLHRLRAELPGPLAIFEHEAMLNALVLRRLDERAIDPEDWPGRGLDGPLYDVGAGATGTHLARVRGRAPSLETLAWPDAEALLAGGVDTAVLPLGSIEQHGPHLPFATDAWIAEALAERFCARFPETIRLPALPFGCAREHLAFAGTLSLEAETLAAVVTDVARSLAAHGIPRLLLLSAHGGNDAVLARLLPELRRRAPEVDVLLAPGPGEVLPRLQAEGESLGVPASAGGLHAGEIETSILLALAPGSVRTERFARGLVDAALPPAELFYPSLRTHAAEGTVGDPRPADAARAERYLEVWVDALADAYRREKNRK